MPAEGKKEIALEIAHVLFIDIIGYSKLSINDQHASGRYQVSVDRAGRRLIGVRLKLRRITSARSQANSSVACSIVAWTAS
jgi:hypothetical protein